MRLHLGQCLPPLKLRRLVFPEACALLRGEVRQDCDSIRKEERVSAGRWSVQFTTPLLIHLQTGGSESTLSPHPVISDLESFQGSFGKPIWEKGVSFLFFFLGLVVYTVNLLFIFHNFHSYRGSTAPAFPFHVCFKLFFCLESFCH